MANFLSCRKFTDQISQVLSRSHFFSFKQKACKTVMNQIFDLKHKEKKYEQKLSYI